MIHLANNYYLDADRYAFVILERVVHKTGIRKGEEKFLSLEYHTTLKAVFNAVNELLVKKSVEVHWNKNIALNEYKRLNKALDKITEPTFTKSFFAMKQEND